MNTFSVTKSVTKISEITIFEREGESLKEVGRYNGESWDLPERIDDMLMQYERNNPVAVINRFDGPNLFAERTDGTVDKSGTWVPYEGPKQGSGWREVGEDNVVYDDEPPGPIDGSVLSADQIETLQDQFDGELPVAEAGSNVESDSYPTSSEQPRRNIESPQQAAEVASSDFEEDAEYDYWRQAPNDDRITEGSIIEVSESEFQIFGDGIDATVVDKDNQIAVTEDGERVEYGRGTGKGRLLGVWNDPANKVATGQVSSWRSVSDEVTPDEIQRQLDEQDEMVDMPEPEPSVESVTSDDWAEEYFDGTYEIDLGEVESGMVAEIAGAFEEITDVDGGTITTDTGGQFGATREYEVKGGVLTRSRASAVVGEQEQYLEFSQESEIDDGFYISTDAERNDEGKFVIRIQGEDGQTYEVDRTEPEACYQPMEFDPLTSDNDSPWESYDGEYMDDADMEDIPVALEDFAHEQFSDEQAQQCMNGLAKADEVGLVDDLDRVKATDSFSAVARYDPDTKLMSFNVDRFEGDELSGLRDNFYAGDQPEDVVVHESIHCKHAEVLLEDPEIDEEELKTEWLNERLDQLEKEIMEEDVSEYAASNPLEVVAEIGTKIIKGEEVSDRAMALYERYRGPEL